MKITHIIKEQTTDKEIVFATMPEIIIAVSEAFKKIVANKPEWRSRTFTVSFGNGRLHVSPISAATPDFIKTLETLLQEAANVVTEHYKEEERQRAQKQYQKEAIIKQLSETLNIPAE